MKKKLFSILLIAIALLCLTGCGNNEDSKSSKNRKDRQSEKDSSLDEGETITITPGTIAKFNEEGYASITVTDPDFTHYTVIIDKNYKVRSMYQYNATLVGEYVEYDDTSKKDTVNIYDVDGNVVYTYNKYDYNKVELYAPGVLLINKQEDSYNSSTNKTGVYSLKDEKWIMEPTEEYDENVFLLGDYVFNLKGNTEFFNPRNAKKFNTNEYMLGGFFDGYGVITDGTKMIIYDDSGNRSEMTIPEYTSGRDHKRNHNGYYVIKEDDIEEGNKYFLIYDLKNKKVIDLSKKYNFVDNDPEFTKEGYALVETRNTGGVSYYTVIDGEGKMQFDPVKVEGPTVGGSLDPETNCLEVKNLTEGSYIILSSNDDNHFELRDKDNKLVYKAKEHERILDVTNNSIMIESHEPGKAIMRYYLDMNGKKINITKSDKVKTIK